MGFSDPPPRRNLLGLSEDQLLWRVFPLARALQLFESKTNVLVSPAKWDDPFENFLSLCSVDFEGTPAQLGGLTSGFLGQCWTHAERETDATWRIYAPASERGVRLRVRAGSLFDTIWNAADQLSAISCFLGVIEYVEEDALKAWLSSLRVAEDLLHSDGIAIAKTLLIKRVAFSHEAEVRLLFQETDNTKKHRPIRAFPCDPNSLVESILLDPRWSPAEARSAEAQFRCFGFAGEIVHSPLYRLPSFAPVAL